MKLVKKEKSLNYRRILANYILLSLKSLNCKEAKFVVVSTLVFICPIMLVKGQEGYIYLNNKISLAIYPDTSFELYTLYDKECESGDNGVLDQEELCWASGKTEYRNDTLVCTDSMKNKILFFKKIDKDRLALVHNVGFNDKKNPDNYGKVTYYKEFMQEKEIFIGEELKSYPIFYVIYIFNVNEKGEKIFQNIYSWEKGEKQIIYDKESNYLNRDLIGPWMPSVTYE